MNEITLYCFIYRIEENLIYRQEHIANPYKGSYIFHDLDDETVYISGSRINVPKLNYGVGHSSIYMYSLDKDIHKAMDLIHEAIKNSLDALDKNKIMMQRLLDTFEEKQRYIKDKYPVER